MAKDDMKTINTVLGPVVIPDDKREPILLMGNTTPLGYDPHEAARTAQEFAREVHNIWRESPHNDGSLFCVNLPVCPACGDDENVVADRCNGCGAELLVEKVPAFSVRLRRLA